MRILLHSNSPKMKTGYGQQCAIWAPRWRDLGHDVAISGYTGNQHFHMEWEGMPLFGAGSNSMGMDVISYYYEKWRADVVIALTDCWAMNPQTMRLMNTVCWTPVDSNPLGAGIRDFLDESNATPLAMSKFGQRLFREAAYDAGYIPHGLPVDIFRPPEDREALRAESGFAEDDFVILLNQANRSGLRKALAEQVAAIAEFRRRHPDLRVRALFHMAKNHEKGQNLPLLLDKHGIGEGVAFFPDQGVYAAGEIEMADMPGIYGAADVTLAAAMAGGFELPIAESQLCGTPVITTNGSAMTEVAGPHSWLVPAQDFWVQPTHEAFWDMPLIGHKCSACGHEDGIVAALEGALLAKQDGRMEALRKTSREHALQYDADVILRDFWKPYLEGVEASL
jgi:glycosyltransferase involved in cell wall biosynthesis